MTRTPQAAIRRPLVDPRRNVPPLASEAPPRTAEVGGGTGFWTCVVLWRVGLVGVMLAFGGVRDGKRAVTAADILGGHVSLDLECLDRIYLNGYVPNLQVG